MFTWQATAQDEAGNVVPLPVVTVYLEDGATLASIFDEDGTPLANPFTGTMEGFVQFQAYAGSYYIVGESGGAETEVWSVTLGLNEAQGSYDEAVAFAANSGFSVVSAIINGSLIEWVRDADGPCLNGGWAPAGDTTPFHFGAMADGTEGPADLIALNGATSYLISKGGGTLVISGDLKTDNAWVITGAHNVTIEGRGISKITNTSTSIRDVIRLDGCTNVTVTGLQLDGMRDIKPGQMGGGNRGIKIAGGSNIIVTRCLIENCREHGISVGTSDTDDRETHRVIIKGNFIRNNGAPNTSRGNGIWFYWKVYDFVVANNVLIDNEGGGVFVDDISSSATPGGSCLRFVITGNTIYTTRTDMADSIGTHQAIGVGGSRDFTISGNQCHGYRNGIVLEGSQANEVTGRGSVTGNTVRAYGRAFTARNAGRAVVSGNRFEAILGSLDDDVTRPCVELGNYHDGATNLVRDILFHGNDILSYKGGIGFISTPASRGTIAGVVITSNRVIFTGVNATGHNGVAINNATDPVCDGNHVTGFDIGIQFGASAASAGIATICRNFVTDCLQAGLRTVVTNVIFKDNVTARNGAGLALTSGANNANTLIVGNVFRDTVPVTGSVHLTSTTRQYNIPEIAA